MSVLRRAAAIRLVTAGLTAWPGSAGATVVLALDFDRMAAEADRAVVGTVVSVHARWSADGERIETVVDLEIEQDMSGVSGPPVLRIVQPGGTIGDVGLVVFGLPAFHEGERALLFLRAGGVDGFGEAHHSVFGMAQGKFAILPRLGGGWDAVQQFPDGLAPAAEDAGGTIRVVHAHPIAMDLALALDRIRRIRREVMP
ncbi:MAG: hypothetical protein QME96_15890 [Myxococcota bacterium]|nr:hypothetical protein [Myxococcota bacterium]